MPSVGLINLAFIWASYAEDVKSLAQTPRAIAQESKRSSISSLKLDPSASQSCWPLSLDDDPRWLLTRSVVAGRHFAKSTLLSKFLLYVVSETIQGRDHEITEHQIGVQVFGRPEDYRTVEDNIVRNYARQMRKRLAEHFGDHKFAGSMRIEIPLGGYVPVFVPSNIETVEQDKTPASISIPLKPHDSQIGHLRMHFVMAASNRQRLFFGASLIAYSLIVIGITLLISSGLHTVHTPPETAQLLWTSLFGGSNNTYIVPPDEGLNLIEDISGHPIPLADYIKGDYLSQPLSQVDRHSSDDLRTQQFTEFSNLQIIGTLVHLKEYDPRHVFLRFPRDLRFDDLKDGNAVILGSVCSNPWAAIADSGVNFHIVCSEGMQGSIVVNAKPMSSEQATYASHWNEPAHATYALITFRPNLSGNGHILLLQGLDVAGTQAAAEAVLHSNTIDPILRLARRADGSLGSFEILLRSTSIQSNATGTEVIASRIS